MGIACVSLRLETDSFFMIVQGYKELNLMYFFTAGEKEVKRKQSEMTERKRK